MLTAAIHECPRCTGAIKRCNYAEVVINEERTDKFLLCEFCAIGWEQSWYGDGTLYSLYFMQRTEPVQFGRFLQRLEEARAA